MYLAAEGASLAHATAWILNVQRAYDAMRHAPETSNICLNISVPSLTLPPTLLPMTPVSADSTKLVLEYSLEKEQIRSEILAEAFVSAVGFGGRLMMLEVAGRCSTNTNVTEIEVMEMEVHASAYTHSWWIKWWMSLEMISWPNDGKGNKIATYDENETEEEKTEALAYTLETIATPHDYDTNNNIQPSQKQEHAPNKPKNETNTIAFRSAANATTPTSFIALVIEVLASIFCFLPSSHSDPANEMMPPVRQEPEPDMPFQPLPFNSERTQAVWKRPHPSNQQEPAAAETDKPTWSRHKGKGLAPNPPVSEWTAITSGRKCKGPAPPSFVLDRTSIPVNRRGKGPEAPRPSEQPDDGADQIWKPVPFEGKGTGPAPPSPIPKRTSSKEADACRLSKTLGKAYSTGRVPVEMMKKRSEELLQEAYALGWGLDLKAETPSRLSPTKGDTEGLWLDWEEEPTPNSRHRHKVPAMPSSLESTTVPPSEAEKPSRVSPTKGDTEGLWLDWDEPEPEPIPRHRHKARVAASNLEPTRTSPPEAEAVDLDLEGPPVPGHITPVTSLDSGLDLDIMPGSYADPSQDTPRPQFTPVFGSSTAPSQQLQLIAPPPSPPRRPFYSLSNAQLHGRDVVALRSYPHEDDEYIPLALERYLFAQIRPPFLHDHNNIIGPRVLAHTRPRGEVQMRRIKPTVSRAYEGRGPAARTFEEMYVELEEAESGEDESYADDLRGTWGQGARRTWF